MGYIKYQSSFPIKKFKYFDSKFFYMQVDFQNDWLSSVFECVSLWYYYAILIINLMRQFWMYSYFLIVLSLNSALNSNCGSIYSVVLFRINGNIATVQCIKAILLFQRLAIEFLYTITILSRKVCFKRSVRHKIEDLNSKTKGSSISCLRLRSEISWARQN